MKFQYFKYGLWNKVQFKNKKIKKEIIMKRKKESMRR